ncbi:MAG: GNAT family N-acetyltransferase [Candidatus Thorarchaeota archaeon]
MESDKSIEEIASGIEKLSSNESYKILIALNEDGAIIGWIYYYIGMPPMAFINGFLPIVKQSEESEDIATALIEASKKDVIERGYSRLEIQFDLMTDAYRTMQGKYVDWYKKCGFQFASEEAHMKTNLKVIDIPDSDLPDGYMVRKFSDLSYEQLELAGLQTFQNGGDLLFRSMNRNEQIVTLKFFFDKTKPYLDDSSLVLVKKGRVVGFVIARRSDDEAEIGPVGLVPEVQGQGLGSYLLGSSLKNLRNIGLIAAFLDMSVSNLPAKRLYSKFGFEDVYYKQFYYWAP